MKIGIPRALLYFWYGSFWEKYWNECGVEVVVSPPTDSRIIADGSGAALDEICLPVKIFLGHLCYLNPQVDRIMIPHLVKVEKDAYICPKFMGLPDIVRHTLPSVRPKMLTVKVGPKKTDMRASLNRATISLGLKPPPKTTQGFEDYRDMPDSFSDSRLLIKPTVGILGHPYCIYDAALNLDLLKVLGRNRVGFVTPEMMPTAYRGVGSGKLSKKLFWTIGKSQFDAMDWMLNTENVDGFIHVAAFACGLEAIIGDLIERRVKEAGKPLLKLNFEEHSGEAGLITRLEAFLDLLNLRIKAC